MKVSMNSSGEYLVYYVCDVGGFSTDKHIEHYWTKDINKATASDSLPGTSRLRTKWESNPLEEIVASLDVEVVETRTVKIIKPNNEEKL
tara:strand:- start:16538 stop:16804 length:267 start_codon:yes stop_codon:yes gene_type:complete